MDVDDDQPQKKQLGALANLCSKDMPIKRELVDKLLKEETRRGGVTKLARSLRVARDVFIADPGEGCAPGQVPEAPDKRKLCHEVHPGHCSTQDKNHDTVILFGLYLHTLSVDLSLDIDALEPLVMSYSLNDAKTRAHGFGLFRWSSENTSRQYG